MRLSKALRRVELAFLILAKDTDMRSRFCILLLLGLPLLVPASARAQYPWSGILDTSRATDWSQAGISSGIPTYATVCQTVALSTGSGNAASNTTAINNALSACKGTGKVVSLPAGTYYVNGIQFPKPATDEVLRGEGPDKTVLRFTNGTACYSSAADGVCMAGNTNYDTQYVGSTAWTGDASGGTCHSGTYAKGDTVICVGSTTGLSATPGASGNIIILDQRNDAIGVTAESESGSTVTITTSIAHRFTSGQRVIVGPVTNNTSLTGYEGVWTIASVPNSTSFTYTDTTTGLSPNSGNGDYAAVDNGGIFNCGIWGVCVIDKSGLQGRSCPDANDSQCQTNEISQRSQTETKEITAINGNEVTITPPLMFPNWRSSQAPGVWWTGAYSESIGIEGLTLDYTNSSTPIVDGIAMYACYACWARNIRSIKAANNHVLITYSAKDDIVDSYFWGSRGTSESSGIDATVSSSNVLIQNNICQNVLACQYDEGDSGSVWAYNYSVTSGVRAPDWMNQTFVSNHGYASYNLSEGNDVVASDVDNGHGNSVADTLFRNRARGQDTPATGQDLWTIADYAYNRAENYIGNVLGTSGVEGVYQDTTNRTGGPMGNGRIFLLTQGAGSLGFSVPADPVVLDSLLRWGNYDVVTGAARWCGNSSDPGWTTTCNSTSEIPTTGMTYINGNAVPSGTTLPPSFYLSAQPSWWQTPWGTPPWPAIGPDVTGGTAPDGAGGHSYAIPAQLCYENTPIDPSYQQSFPVTGATVASGYWPYNVTMTIGTNSIPQWGTITVSGANPSTFDGTFQVVATTSTTVTYGMQTNPGTYTSGGTVAWPNILLYNATNCYPAAYGTPNSVMLSATPH